MSIKKNESQRLSGAYLLVVGFDEIEPSEPVPKPGSASSFNCLSSSFRSTISSYQARRLAVPNSAKVNGYFNRPIFDQRPAFECFWYLADLAYSLGIALWQLPRVAESATPTPSTSSVTGAGDCSWNGESFAGLCRATPWSAMGCVVGIYHYKTHCRSVLRLVSLATPHGAPHLFLCSRLTKFTSKQT